MDFENNYLILSDANADNVLNKQSITSIRVWGVGRDNGRFVPFFNFLSLNSNSKNKKFFIYLNS